MKSYYVSVLTEKIVTYRSDCTNTKFGKLILKLEQGWSPSPSDRKEDNGWEVLTLAAVKNGQFHKRETKPFVGNSEKCGSLRLQRGDFLLTRSNTRNLVGQVCIVNEEIENLIFSDLIYRITLDEEWLLPDYASFLLQSAYLRQQIERDAHGSSSTMVKITHKDIENWDIFFPKTTIQREISLQLRTLQGKIDIEIENRKKIIEWCRDYKRALIYEVVTGKKDI